MGQGEGVDAEGSLAYLIPTTDPLSIVAPHSSGASHRLFLLGSVSPSHAIPLVYTHIPDTYNLIPHVGSRLCVRSFFTGTDMDESPSSRQRSRASPCHGLYLYVDCSGRVIFRLTHT